MTKDTETVKTMKAAREFSRRTLLAGAAASGGVAAVVVGSSQLGAPWIGTAKAQTTTWRIQTSWPGGIGLETFKGAPG